MRVNETSLSYHMEDGTNGVPAGYKQTEVGLIPSDWEARPLGALVTITSGESPSHFRFGPVGIPYFKVEQLNNSPKYLGSEETDYFLVGSPRTIPAGSVVFPKRGASIMLNKIRLLKASGYMDTNMMALTPGGDLDSGYLFYTLSHLGLASVADVTSIPQINNKHIHPFLIPFPSLSEQRVIAETLSNVDDLIASLAALIEKKRAMKHGAIQQLLTGRKRLPGFAGEWRTYRVGDVLQYERPDKYIVGSSDYLESGIPVLTAGKTFILGYTDESFGVCRNLPVVIFDDFTTASRFIMFPFKVKSSALKLLRPRSDSFNLAFIAGLMTITPLSVGDHRRHYISDYQGVELSLPGREEQRAIAAVLSDIETEIGALEAQLAKTRHVKLGMMQQLLTGRIRLTQPKPPAA